MIGDQKMQSLKKKYSFEEYLNYRDHTDNKYELVNGELFSMPPASGIHALITMFLLNIFIQEIAKINAEWQVFPGNIGVRTAETKSRIPDLVILTAKQCQEIRSLTSAVLNSPPQLVVEIVSPGNPEDDYRYKRSEYAVREIPEYWIIDPQELKVSVLLLVDGFYEVTEFTNKQKIISQTFPKLQLTVDRVFSV